MENYEQKYKKALGWMQSLYSGLHGAIKEDAEHYFPELKEQESEDERIRQEIIGILKGETRYTSKEDADKYVTWLEKQGEQTQLDYEYADIPQKDFAPIEPKFKVGDWIVQENIGIYKVIEVCESWYEVVDNKDEHYSISFNKEYMCHLWSINDAKNGDVLVAKGGYFKEYVFKFSSFTEDNVISTHFGYDVFHGNFDTKLSRFGREEDFEFVNPATKEQRDLLFSKMKEAGYEWDADKKELKKIEPKKLEADKVIAWLKGTMRETKEYFGEHDVYYSTRLTLPYNSVEDCINDFKEDFGL